MDAPAATDVSVGDHGDRRDQCVHGDSDDGIDHAGATAGARAHIGGRSR